jgi:hypothetical protein
MFDFVSIHSRVQAGKRWARSMVRNYSLTGIDIIIKSKLILDSSVRQNHGWLYFTAVYGAVS